MSFLPVVALVGRPNVGKSTLFNVLTRSKDALVADFPGLTRDRQYGLARRGSRPLWVVDTGGMIEEAAGLDVVAMRQVDEALSEADIVLFMVDARAGLNAADETVAARLRRLGKPVLLVANKIDGLKRLDVLHEFYALGLGEPVGLAASHAMGLDGLLEALDGLLPEPEEDLGSEEAGESIRIAVLGRPNVGKSTLVNRLLGEERVVVFDQPGTTRDSIFIPFEREGQAYTLIDTAGVRRRARVEHAIEKFSIVKTLQAIERADVVIYLVDAREGVTDQDAHLLGTILDAGRALVIGLNKWDGLADDQRQSVRRQIDLKLEFVSFAEKHFISALHGSGVGTLFDTVQELYSNARRSFATPLLTRLLSEAVSAHQPPMSQRRRARLKYAHQGGTSPPTIIIHGNQTDSLPEGYRRYLNNFFRQKLRLAGTPLRLEFRSGENPFKDQKNTLTERQVQSRRRMMRFVRKGR